ncbi:MAG TPA: magnesium transporter [Candidatus Korarchaeota archaeon]|nr:magnesium transporter [Candidatus Korarchaeota archaeon]
MRVMTEIVAATAIVVSLESIAGIFLGEAISISDVRVLLIYPAMLTELGDASSIIGSILTTRLFLGLLRRKIPIIDVMPEVTGVFAVFLGFFSLMGGILWFHGGNPLVSIVTFLIAFPIILLITSSVVMLTSRRFDPDNFTIPLATSSADLVTTATVAAVLSLLGG